MHYNHGCGCTQCDYVAMLKYAADVAACGCRIISGTAEGDDWGRLGKRSAPLKSEASPAAPLPRSDNLYSHMTYKWVGSLVLCWCAVRLHEVGHVGRCAQLLWCLCWLMLPGSAFLALADMGQTVAGCKLCIMPCRPLSSQEAVRYSQSLHDGRPTGRRVLTPPGSQDPLKGKDLLAWKPEVRMATYVPHGKLAQEGKLAQGTTRELGGTSRGTGRMTRTATHD